MSYQVLARKWRPKKFQELMGQEHVVNVLTNALSQQRLHHAYLFTGTRGVGKTTIARIFAKSLNCEEGITATPCGICDACVDIDQGRFVDLLEIDAASRTKVDDTREILDNVQYAPSRGRYKVYLIDEVHMLSRSSFNALLKTLEEPPEHVKFILATTDPQKLPITVLSRCLQFHLKALTVQQIKKQLEAILTAENVTYDTTSIALLAKAARGSMRDSLSLTDQAIAQGQGDIQFTHVQQMLGGVDQHWPYKILIALLKQDAQALMQLSLEIASYSPNYSRLLAELIQLLHQIAMTQIVGSHFDLSPDHEKLLHKFCVAMSPEDVQLYYQICLNGRKDLPYAMDEQAAFDMTLLRLAAFQPQANTSSLAENSVQKQESAPVLVNFDDVSLTDPPSQPNNLVNSLAGDIALPEQNTEIQAKMDNEKVPDVSHVNIQNTVVDEQAHEALQQQAAELENVAQAHGIDRTFQASEHNSLDIPSADNVEQPPLAESDMFLTPNTVEENTSLEPSDGIQDVPATSSADTQGEIQTTTTQTPSSAIESVLASRNMLRSRKKQLERDGKKPEGATKRQPSQVNTSAAQTLSVPSETPESVQPEPLNNAPAIDAVAEQIYQPDIIDPVTIRSANQIDKWANMIDHMALNGRLRQLAIHATICQSSNDNHLVLQLDQSTKHLQTEQAHIQLQQAISNLLQRDITVEIKVVEETIADPYKIQSDINSKRYQYAKELLLADETVLHLQKEFQAELDKDSIVAK